MKPYPTEDQLLQLLDDNGIDYVISERMEGIVYLMFTLDDTFKPGTKDDWHIQLCGDVHLHAPEGGMRIAQQWAIFNKKTGKEWRDANGWGRAFESEREARSYLDGFFDAWKGVE